MSEPRSWEEQRREGHQSARALGIMLLSIALVVSVVVIFFLFLA